MFGSISNAQLEIIDNYFKQFVQLVQYKKNKFDYIESTGNAKVDKMFEQWNNLIFDTEENIKNDMKVLGETVLTLDKVEKGTFRCRINSKTTNPMIHTLSSGINGMLDTLEKDMKRLGSAMDSYTNNDYSKSVHISPRVKDRMLELMNSANKLGQSLATNAKTNLKNGQTLE
ncbi:MAG: hypothetical protein ACQERD_03570, partial [Campylobacterota bacterium]